VRPFRLPEPPRVILWALVIGTALAHGVVLPAALHLCCAKWSCSSTTSGGCSFSARLVVEAFIPPSAWMAASNFEVRLLAKSLLWVSELTLGALIDVAQPYGGVVLEMHLPLSCQLAAVPSESSAMVVPVGADSPC
jgi:hypothetical protein